MSEPDDDVDQTEGYYRRYGEAVHRRCRRLLGDEALAWDMTQEVFLRAHAHLRHLRGASSPLSWLLTVADRQCFSVLRRRRTEAASELALRAPAEGSRAAPDDALERWLVDADLVRHVLAHCPEDVQRIVAHRFLDELEQEQIAALLDVSRKTVQRKLQAFFDIARRLLEAPAAVPRKGTALV
ncbi:sigma-70 family RNA polymerase sigma factor [Pyxidicoccus parkwayensis]|uniref:Sigma-70 family RNA polymerase sigma factor n=1 Tax=Pyxidicoccus parkwayensis TaxID=2813578 RepID=A0ABX7NXH4_9BACT|nr:sigma-70 family RNA polymerase sigma factor [Pyxidicoccus parkwaysis]QSQ23610.1 sigma-70 family RNA polymerase sigma factor [Pyxidicoccus parkwaysis]